MFGTITNILGLGQKEKEQKVPVEGLDHSATPAVDINFSDEELQTLAKKWESSYKSYYQTYIAQRVQNNKVYLRGDQISSFTQWKQSIPFDEMPGIYNLTWECMEIAAPMATKAMPTVTVLFNDENTEETKLVADEIQSIANKQLLRYKLEMALRDRYTHFIGVLKVYYNVFTKRIEIEKINPTDILVDPNASMSEGIADGEFVGQYVSLSPRAAREKFADKLDLVNSYLGGEKGTAKFVYIEWWSTDLVFATVNGKLLYKMRNPNWNYKEMKDVTDQFGMTSKVEVQKPNHTAKPIVPFLFVNVNNDGTQPHDVTTELEQGIPMQHSLDQAMYQINKNATRCSGYAVSKGINKDSTKDMAAAAWNGGVIALPDEPNADFKIVGGTPLPSFMYEHKMSLEEGIRNIWGVRGSSAQGVLGEQTVRGKILMQGSDGQRINTVTKRLELVCTNVYNYIHQIQCVVEDINHVGFEIMAKEGSMIPKDSMTQRNEAVDLFAQGAVTPEYLYSKLDIPNPKMEAEKFIMYTLDPKSQLNPVLMQQIAMKEQQDAANAIAVAGQKEGAKSAPENTGTQTPAPEPPGQMSTNLTLNQ